LEEGNYMANAGGLNKKAKVENDDLLKLVTFQLGEELYGVEMLRIMLKEFLTYEAKLFR